MFTFLHDPKLNAFFISPFPTFSYGESMQLMKILLYISILFIKYLQASLFQSLYCHLMNKFSTERNIFEDPLKQTYGKMMITITNDGFGDGVKSIHSY